MLLQSRKLTDSTPTSAAGFGSGVAISSNGRVLVVGSYADTGGGTVFVYSGVDWGTQTILQASDRATGDAFGWSVDVSEDGSTIVVGAYSEDGAGSNRGAAYVYSGSSWSTETKLTASDAADTDRFGYSVAISGDGSTVAVGADEKNGAGTDRGAAYVYSGSNWSTETKLTASDAANSDVFGTSISISGDGSIVAVGAPFESLSAGAVYVYSGANWVTETKLTTATAGFFGVSVDISYDGTLIVAGANLNDTTASNAGAAHIRYGASWGSEIDLLASDGAAEDNFGSHIAISRDGSTIVVGSWADDDPIAGNNCGAAYVYSGPNWGIEKKITASDRADGDLFGERVAISGDGSTVIVGVWRKDTAGLSNSGAVYAYTNAVGYQRLAGPTHLSDSSEVLFYSPLFARTQIRNIHISNPTGSNRTVTLSIGADAASTRVLEEFVIPADSTLSLRNASQYILTAGEEMRGYASVADVVSITVNGYVGAA